MKGMQSIIKKSWVLRLEEVLLFQVCFVEKPHEGHGLSVANVMQTKQ